MHSAISNKSKCPKHIINTTKQKKKCILLYKRNTYCYLHFQKGIEEINTHSLQYNTQIISIFSTTTSIYAYIVQYNNHYIFNSTS